MSVEPVAAPASTDYRRRLLDGMAATIRERGYRQSTIADIVREARTSARTFYEHFPSKEDCYIALLQQANQHMVAGIAAAVDPHGPWQVQVEQAVTAWIRFGQIDPPVTLSWIREAPTLGDRARELQRQAQHGFVLLVETLTDTAELRAAGVAPPARDVIVMLLGGLRELLATAVEDGRDLDSLIPVAVSATQALLNPER